MGVIGLKSYHKVLDKELSELSKLFIQSTDQELSIQSTDGMVQLIAALFDPKKIPGLLSRTNSPDIEDTILRQYALDVLEKEICTNIIKIQKGEIQKDEITEEELAKIKGELQSKWGFDKAKILISLNKGKITTETIKEEIIYERFLVSCEELLATDKKALYQDISKSKTVELFVKKNWLFFKDDFEIGKFKALVKFLEHFCLENNKENTKRFDFNKILEEFS
ncbi:hypothetical protein, partial [Candidatus Cyrtobacter comes]|uniref:hypothetical protein n=1 Tax=Candidatus Cyrtobacter comes TaxID=675776 RepID=UPI002ACE8CC8